jgi:dTDP-4-amino-4,6-dideoxygalactose transaminase
MTTDRISMVDMAAEYAQVGPAIEEAVVRVLRSGQYVLGPETKALEEEVAAYIGTPFALGVGSGTEALILALLAVGVSEGDEVITTPFTFFATIEAIRLVGAIPIFADIEEDSFNLDGAKIEAAITARTKAIMPVHLFGRCADMLSIRKVADAHGLPVIEDAAQSIGAARAGRSAGNWGSAGCFSFYPAKNLGAAGDGGCVTTDDEEVYERLQLLRAHGSKERDVHEAIGTTSRLDSLQAAVLRVKLPHLDEWTAARGRSAAIYAEGLESLEGLRLPTSGTDETLVWNQYAICAANPDPIRNALTEASIDCRHFYPKPAYLQPALGRFMQAEGACPEAEKRCAEVICLPMHPFLTESQVRRVVETISKSLL